MLPFDLLVLLLRNSLVWLLDDMLISNLPETDDFLLQPILPVLPTLLETCLAFVLNFRDALLNQGETLQRYFLDCPRPLSCQISEFLVQPQQTLQTLVQLSRYKLP